ncbi:hypothetical protein LTR08_002148 [Meristemomyces frigidus]|nr:hypothetical protein LTR08_002148 [Meristemomyces frigidus]
MITPMGRIQIGTPAPDFKCTAVVDGRLKAEVSLSSYTQANHWLILAFFPKAWSSICPTEIKAFSSRLEEFSTPAAAPYDMEGGLGGVHVPIISDCNHKLSRDYGVLDEDKGVAQRALFIIDPKGIVRSITVHDTYIGRSVNETQRVLDALIFQDEFGEGCPVDWRKGDKGMSSAIPLEGRVELKKSWAEWARPKLHRGLSGTSARSARSVTSVTSSPTRLTHETLGSGRSSPMVSSPMVSPMTSSPVGGMEGQMEEAIAHKRENIAAVENIQAAMQNQGIGLAN